MKFMTGDSKIIKGDLEIEGAVTCYSLQVQDPAFGGRIDTGPLGGIGAGLQGFTSGLGGLSLGFPSPLTPIAAPVSIFAAGPIVSLTSMLAPLGTFGYLSSGISSSIHMFDVINTLFYNIHLHPGKVYGPPTAQFI